MAAARQAIHRRGRGALGRVRARAACAAAPAGVYVRRRARGRRRQVRAPGIRAHRPHCGRRRCAHSIFMYRPRHAHPACRPAEFTAALLAKNTALIASGRGLDCTVCHAPLDMHASVSTPDLPCELPLTSPPAERALHGPVPARGLRRGVAPRVPCAAVPRGGGRRRYGVHTARRALCGVCAVHAVGRRRARVLPPPPAERAGLRGHRERRHVRHRRGPPHARAAQGGRREAQAPGGNPGAGQQRGRVVRL